MYLTAHHVRTAAGPEGVNAFLYLHRDADWEVPPVGLPDGNPGELVRSEVTVPPGNNPVRSYLDVVAPDGTPWDEIGHGLVTFVAIAHEKPLPWVGIVRRSMYRFGIEAGLAPLWRHEIATLLRASQQLFEAQWPKG